MKSVSNRHDKIPVHAVNLYRHNRNDRIPVHAAYRYRNNCIPVHAVSSNRIHRHHNQIAKMIMQMWQIKQKRRN